MTINVSINYELSVGSDQRPCKIYVSNKGTMEAMQAQVITDSKALASFNHRALPSRVEASEKGVIVKLYYLEVEENGII